MELFEAMHGRPRVFPEVSERPRWTQGDVCASKNAERSDYLSTAIAQVVTRDASSLSSPVQSDSFLYHVLFLLDSSIALFNRHSVMLCVARMKQQLEKALGGSAVHDGLPTWLKCGCDDPTTGNISLPILTEVAKRLHVNLVVYDGDQVRYAAADSPNAAFIFRPTRSAPYQLHLSESGPLLDLARARHLAALMYLDTARPIDTSQLTVRQLQRLAENLAVEWTGLSKVDLRSTIRSRLQELEAGA